ncbi:MAG: protease HtpX [Bdellovibrionales bacterium]
MALIRRFGLFIMVNLLVMFTITIVLNLLGVGPYLSAQGLDYSALMIFCLVWGMGGAFISLAISRWMAKKAMGVQVISPDVSDSGLRQLVETVHSLARSAGLREMPEVGIYDSPDINAFATGPSRNKSLVAVSTGLLHRMNPDQVRGVLGHEVAHIANGDMVTMTLIQGVVNAFVMFLARAIAFAITSSRGSDDRESSGGGMSYFLVTMALEMVFMIFGSMVVAWFSRYREFRADAGGARLAGRDSMVNALEGLKRAFDPDMPEEQTAIASLKISGRPSRFLALFSTHPPLEQRIERLRIGAVG